MNERDGRRDARRAAEPERSEALSRFMERVEQKYPHLRCADDGDRPNAYKSKPARKRKAKPVE